MLSAHRFRQLQFFFLVDTQTGASDAELDDEDQEQSDHVEEEHHLPRRNDNVVVYL